MDLRQGRDPLQSFDPGQDLGPPRQVREQLAQPLGRVRIHHHGKIRPMPTALLGQALRIPIGGERNHPKTIRVASQHVERADTNGTRRTQYGYAFHHATPVK